MLGQAQFVGSGIVRGFMNQLLDKSKSEFRFGFVQQVCVQAFLWGFEVQFWWLNMGSGEFDLSSSKSV